MSRELARALPIVHSLIHSNSHQAAVSVCQTLSAGKGTERDRNLCHPEPTLQWRDADRLRVTVYVVTRDMYGEKHSREVQG